MNRRSVLTNSVPMALAAALLPSSVVAQQKSIKDQIVGTWIFVSAQDARLRACWLGQATSTSGTNSP